MRQELYWAGSVLGLVPGVTLGKEFGCVPGKELGGGTRRVTGREARFCAWRNPKCSVGAGSPSPVGDVLDWALEQVLGDVLGDVDVPC
jgi:hypothetical protein